MYDNQKFQELLQESANYLDNSQESQAVASLKKALDLKLDIFTLGIPGFKKALQERFLAVGEFAKIVAKTKNTEIMLEFVYSIRFFRFDQSDENIEKAILVCLNNKNINPQNLFVPSLGLIKQKSLSIVDPLLLALLENVIIADPDLETFLTAKRKEFLFKANDENFLKQHRAAIYALALQCDINEYIYAASEQENDLVEQLWNHIVSSTSDWDSHTKLQIAILGSYRPLHSAFKTMSWSPAEDDPAFSLLLKRQIFDRQTEDKLRTTIPLLNSIEDQTSKKVRVQYEEYPYPRWIRLDRQTPVSLEQNLTSMFPHLKEEGILWPEHLQILVAGCGTGEHAIKYALGYRNCEVTAMDLSLSSLAYGKRMADEMGIRNVRFIQGDILDFYKIEEKFDLIECSGVLHHMQDPLAGWEVLTHLLKKDAWMCIGLYSDLARSNITKAQQYIAEKKYQGDAETIRKCRQEILNKPIENPLKSVSLLQDFYTMSTCRDLLFHVHEVRFTLPEIEAILKTLKLEFVGFNLPVKSVKERFQSMFPEETLMTSLQNWHHFEQSNPDTFSGMYQFWTTKR